MKILYAFLFLLPISCNTNDAEIRFPVKSVIDDTLLIAKKDSSPPVTKLPKIGCGPTYSPEITPYFSGCGSFQEKDERKKCSETKLIDFIYEHIEYPQEAKEKEIEGTAVVRFTIEKNGQLSFDDDLNKVILRDPGGGCGEEALRVIKLMPKWNPAMMAGKPIRMQFTCPVKFVLKDHKLEKAPPPAPSTDEVYKIVEYMPHFPGCEDIEDKNKRKRCSDEKIISFINKNIKYPKELKEKGIDGTTIISFIVEKDGSISFHEEKNKVILRGEEMGKEAIRVIKSMPKWIPGKHRGELARVQFTIPIRIQFAE